MLNRVPCVARKLATIMMKCLLGCLWKVVRFGQHWRIHKKCNTDSGFVDAKSGEAWQMFLMMTFLSGKFSGTWLMIAQRVAICVTERHMVKTQCPPHSPRVECVVFLLHPFSIYGCLPRVCPLPLFGWLEPQFSWMVCVSGFLPKHLLVFEGVLVPTSFKVRRFRGVSKLKQEKVYYQYMLWVSNEETFRKFYLYFFLCVAFLWSNY